MKAIYRFGLLATVVALAGCAGTFQSPNTQSGWATDVLAIQTAVPVLEGALASYPAIANNPAVAKAEVQINAAVAALGTTPAPANAAAILTDLQTLAAALPPGTLSPAHQAELSAGLALAKLLVAAASQAPT